MVGMASFAVAGIARMLLQHYGVNEDWTDAALGMCFGVSIASYIVGMRVERAGCAQAR